MYGMDMNTVCLAVTTVFCELCLGCLCFVMQMPIGWQKTTSHQIQSRAADWKGIVLKRSGSEVSVHHVAGLLVQMANPACKLAGVGQSGRQEHHAYSLGQEDDSFLPNHSPLTVLHVVHLIKDDPCHLSQQL